MNKQGFHVSGHARIASEITQICIELCGSRVVVACRQVAVSLEHAALAPCDQQHFGVRF